MKKYLYIFVLLVCSLFLLACGSKTSSASKIKEILMSSEEIETVEPEKEETVEPEEGTEFEEGSAGCRREKH